MLSIKIDPIVSQCRDIYFGSLQMLSIKIDSIVSQCHDIYCNIKVVGSSHNITIQLKRISVIYVVKVINENANWSTI